MLGEKKKGERKRGIKISKESLAPYQSSWSSSSYSCYCSHGKPLYLNDGSHTTSPNLQWSQLLSESWLDTMGSTGVHYTGEPWLQDALLTNQCALSSILHQEKKPQNKSQANEITSQSQIYKEPPKFRDFVDIWNKGNLICNPVNTH